MRDPLEIWHDARHKRDKYIRIVIDKDGNEVLNVVVNEGGETYSWHSNAVSLDHYRNGVLVYLRTKTTGATDKP